MPSKIETIANNALQIAGLLGHNSNENMDRTFIEQYSSYTGLISLLLDISKLNIDINSTIIMNRGLGDAEFIKGLQETIIELLKNID